MKVKLIKLEIVDNDWQDTYNTYLLVNPNASKLATLKQMVEHRFDTDGLTDEEIAEKENFCDNIWDRITDFINENFVVLEMDETYEIAY